MTSGNMKFMSHETDPGRRALPETVSKAGAEEGHSCVGAGNEVLQTPLCGSGPGFHTTDSVLQLVIQAADHHGLDADCHVSRHKLAQNSCTDSPASVRSKPKLLIPCRKSLQPEVYFPKPMSQQN